MLKSVGALVGSSISLSLNIDQTKPVGVSNAVYIIFLALHASAFFLALFFMIIAGPFLSHATIRAIRVRETGDWRPDRKRTVPTGEKEQ